MTRPPSRALWRLLLVAMAAAALCVLLTPAPATADVSSAFATDDEGWRVVGNDPLDPNQRVVPDYSSAGGNPGGYISATDMADETDNNCAGGGAPTCTTIFISKETAPSPWIGDLSSNWGGDIGFDLLVNGPTPPDGVVAFALYDSTQQMALQTTTATLDPPAGVGAWTHYSLKLTPGSGDFQFCDLTSGDCDPATGQNIYDVLSDSGLAIVGHDGIMGIGEVNGLDNVTLSGGTGPPDNDSDGVNNFEDNCVNSANPTQTDRDKDSLGDACDPDDDGDGVNDTADKCKTIKAGTVSGCPAVTRTLTLAYKAAKQKFTGTLSASKPQCKSAQVVTVFKQRPGDDLKLGLATTTATGTYALSKQVGSGKYYSTVPQKVVVNVAQCNPATSPVLTR